MSCPDSEVSQLSQSWPSDKRISGAAIPLNHAGLRRVSQLSHLSQSILQEGKAKRQRNTARGRGAEGNVLRCRCDHVLHRPAVAGRMESDLQQFTGPSWPFPVRVLRGAVRR